MTERSKNDEGDQSPLIRMPAAGRRSTTRNGILDTVPVRIITIFAAWVVGALVWASPGAAHAQVALQELTWAHSSPDTVARFVVFASMTNGDQADARQINVGKPANPTINSDGSQYIYSAIISVDLNEYVAVAAVGRDGSLSTLSSWSAVPPSTPGQPLLIP